jgi:RNA polymerase sigma factor (sigma-70 family)
MTNEEYQALLQVVVPLIRRKARQLTRRGPLPLHDREDVEQELLVHCLRRLDAFDPAKASRERFATLLVRHAVADLLRHRRAGKRAGAARSLDRRVRTEDGPCALAQLVTPADGQARRGTRPRDALDRAHLALDLAAVLSRLPDDLRALARRLAHQPPRAAARALGWSRGRLAAGLRRLRRVFERGDLQRYLESSPPGRCGAG